MNAFSGMILFAIVLAINLFLLGAVMAGGLWLTFRFIENAAPRLRYLIAVVVFLLVVLFPVVATLGISFEQKPSSNAVGAAGAAIAEAARQDTDENSTGRDSASMRENDAAGVIDKTENISVSRLDSFISFTAGSVFGKLFFGLWLAGACFLIFREALGLRQIQKARKLWKSATEAEKQSLRCPKDVPLYFDRDQSPGTIGLLHPVIVLPEQFFAALPPESRRFIMRHELSHARWRDPLAGVLLRIIRAVFWISPALWLLERLIDAEREAAADRAAIASCSNDAELEKNALSYADALLSAARGFSSFESQNQNRKLPAIGIGGEGNNKLEMRIRRLLSSAQTSRLHVASAIAAVLLTGAAAGVMPLTAFSDKLRIRQNESAVNSDRLSNISGEENLNRLSLAALQPDGLSQKTLRGADREALEPSAPVTAALSKTEKNEQPSIREIADSALARQISTETQNTTESFSGSETGAGDSKALTVTLSSEDAGRVESGNLNRNQPPSSARQFKEAETVTITGNPDANPALSSKLEGNLSSLNKLRNNLTSADKPARRKGPGSLDRLTEPGNTLEPAQELNRITSRSKYLPALPSRNR